MPEQSWCAEGYDTHARFVSDLGTPVVELLNAKPGERILDLGCGDGVLTKKLQDSGCAVVGIDSSRELIEAALRLDLNVSVQNACEIDFHEEFDAVFSNAVLHWIKDADRVIGNVLRALRGSFTSVLPLGDRQSYIDDVRDRLRPLLCGADGVWTADYTRLRFEAHKNPIRSIGEEPGR